MFTSESRREARDLLGRSGGGELGAPSSRRKEALPLRAEGEFSLLAEAAEAPPNLGGGAPITREVRLPSSKFSCSTAKL